MADEVEHQPRATTASIDRRVERLEVLQAETDRKVDSLSIKVEHVKELMDLKFTGLEQHLQAQAIKLDTFIAKIDKLISEGAEKQADLESTPLGKQINRRLVSLETKAEDAESYIEGARGFGAIFAKYILPTAGTVIAVVALLNSIFNATGIP